MKKFLKVFLIIISIIAVIAGTCFFFFSRLKEKYHKTGSIAVMLESEEKKKFNEDLSGVADYLKDNVSDERMIVIVNANKNLDEIVSILAGYKISDNTSFESKEIVSKLNQVNSSRNVLSRMITEFNIKKNNSSKFVPSLGANDLYKQSCSYLAEYAQLADLMNQNIGGLNKISDIKFNVFEIYSNVINISLIKMVDIGDGKIEAEGVANIKAINEMLKINNSFINSSKVFTTDCNNFQHYYSICNKITFAQNFANLKESNLEISNEQKSMKYLKSILG